MKRSEIEKLETKLTLTLKNLEKYLNDEEGYWVLRGFIDVARNVYSLSSDTKLISRALEIMILPVIEDFFARRGFKVILSPEQDLHPDVSLVMGRLKLALDIKTSYRLPGSSGEVSGFAPGAFTGYFRDRKSKKNVVCPYGEYRKHFVLGIIYTDELRIRKISEKITIEEQQPWFTPRKIRLEGMGFMKPPIREIELILSEK